MKNLSPFLLLLFILLSTNCKLFESLSKKEEDFCLSDQLLKQAIEKDPSIQETIDLQNETIRNYEFVPNAGNTQSKASGVANYIIPVVVYVVHNNGPENISDVQIHSQLDRLNTEFNPHGVEFCLATEENGTPLTGTGPDPGIIRIQDPLTDHLTADENALKSLPTPLSATRYLKIWVVKDINSGSGVVGYARFPGSVSPVLEGIVMRYDVFGDVATCGCSLLPNYDQGKVLAHEAGHYLNLYHTFEGGCSGNTTANCDTQGDLVCDTPPVNNANSGCPAGPLNSCVETPTDNNDLLDNHMDYTDDNCRDDFTLGQETRMITTLNTIRNVLVSSQNLVYTGVQCASGILASFSASDYNPCDGETVTFTAANQIGVTYTWDFGDGSPTSTINPVTHSYATGNTSYNVTLTVTDVTNTVSETQVLYVSNCGPIASTQGHWYFGKYAAIDFSTGSPVPNNSAFAPQTMNSLESSVSVSDNSGNLLFYASPDYVWNASHTAISPVLGGNSSASQMAYAPDPGNSNQYYLFLPPGKDQHGTPGNIYRSYVVNPITGFVSTMTPMDVPIGAQTSESITVVPHCNNTDYWIITHTYGPSHRRFYVHLLTATGVTNSSGIGINPDIYPSPIGNFSLLTGGPSAYYAGAQLKASPNGEKLALAGNGLGLYDFDRSTGVISNEVLLNSINNFVGCSFSPNGQRVYGTSASQIRAYNFAGTLEYSANSNGRHLQLGPDNKLYLSYFTANFIGVIPNPNDASPVLINNAASFAPISNQIKTWLGGLPNMIDAAPAPSLIADFTYMISNCYDVSFDATPCFNSYAWNFGDSNTSTLEDPSHTYASDGSYTVTLTVNGSIVVTKTVTIGISSVIAGPQCATLGTIQNYSAVAGPGLIYNWTAVGGSIALNGNSNVDVTWATLPGTLTLAISDPATACISTTTINVDAGSFDLTIKDNASTDLGDEPNPNDIWSGLVWNCWTTLACTAPGEDAEYMNSGTNRMRAEIHNIGCEDYSLPPHKAFLHLYWTIGRAGEIWPNHWETATSTYCGNVAGGAITPNSGLGIPSIASGGSLIMNRDWSPPNPVDFASCYLSDFGTADPMICYLGRIESVDDPIVGEVPGPIANNVKQSNNIATFNSSLFDVDPFNLIGPVKFFILNNPTSISTNVSINFEELEGNSGSFFERGSLTVDLSKLDENGKVRSAGSFTIESKEDLRKLSNLPLKPNEEQIALLRFSVPQNNAPLRSRLYQMEMHCQFSNREVIPTYFDVNVRVRGRN